MCTSRLIRSQNLYARAHKSCAPGCWVRRDRTSADQSPILSCFAQRRPARNGQTRAPRPTSPACPSHSSSSSCIRPFAFLCENKAHYGGQRAPVKFEDRVACAVQATAIFRWRLPKQSTRQSKKSSCNANYNRRPATSSHKIPRTWRTASNRQS